MPACFGPGAQLSTQESRDETAEGKVSSAHLIDALLGLGSGSKKLGTPAKTFNFKNHQAVKWRPAFGRNRHSRQLNLLGDVYDLKAVA